MYYRKQVSSDCRKYFRICYKMTDIAVYFSDTTSHVSEISDTAFSSLVKAWNIIEDYIQDDPAFKTSLTPIPVNSSAHDIIREMQCAAIKAQVGPMASVAGAVAGYVMETLKNAYDMQNIIVENGGDIACSISHETIISIFAGTSVLSGKIGILIPQASHLGIATSAGTFGHSFSFGKADACVVIAQNSTLADAYATSFCNRIQSEADIENILNDTAQIKDIQQTIIICNNTIGVRGSYEICPVTA